MDMVEGKDCPKELPECEFEKQGVKIIGLLLCMLKNFNWMVCYFLFWILSAQRYY